MDTFQNYESVYAILGVAYGGFECFKTTLAQKRKLIPRKLLKREENDTGIYSLPVIWKDISNAADFEQDSGGKHGK